MMRSLRFGPVFILFLVLSGGPTILTLDQIDAACCNIWKPPCRSWSGMVYGSATILDNVATIPMVRITDDKGFTKDIKVSPDVYDEFKSENIKTDYGFSIVNSRTGEPVLIAFVPLNMEHKKPNDQSIQGAGGAVRAWNELFEGEAQKPSRSKS